MPRYWVIAPFGSAKPEEFDAVWQFDRNSNTISIGWDEIGDPSRMSRPQLADAVARQFHSFPIQTQALFTNMIWAFYHDIAPGDIVLARKGRKVLAAIGTVTKSGYYAPAKNAHLMAPNEVHSSFIDVVWHEEPRDKIFASIVFPMHTLMEITEDKYLSLLEGRPTAPPSPEVTGATEDPSAFVLEKYLEDFIVSNFAGIFKGDLKIFVDTEGELAQQYATDIGPIDILAVDPGTNAFVVVELKKGRPSDQVVGQILRYMGWVKANLCAPGQLVRGLVICSEPDTKLSFALSMTNNIDVRYYSVSFKLRETP